ncbi:MAG: hypothetical protein KY428_12930 [Bacteroidetes bacterium]|nr:hypothetical protein [Bacteroidota bacterium]
MSSQPKYRLLSTEELHELEKEFIDFLVVNGITAEDWERLKKEEKEKAESIIVLFSDVVFEGIMREVRFLEIRTKDDVKTFQCLDEKLVLVGMTAEGNEEVDFTDSEFIQNAVTTPPKCIKVYTSDKRYKTDREVELFEMIQSGCSISDGNLFKALCTALD